MLFPARESIVRLGGRQVAAGFSEEMSLPCSSKVYRNEDLFSVF